MQPACSAHWLRSSGPSPAPPVPQVAGALCLWPLALGLAAPGAYARWRELLIPAHLAAQHWIGLRFSMPLESQHRVVRARAAAWPAKGGAARARTAASAIGARMAWRGRLWQPRAVAECDVRSMQQPPSATLPPPGWPQPLQTTPGWVRGLLPVFVASFCQPWLYLVRRPWGSSGAAQHPAQPAALVVRVFGMCACDCSRACLPGLLPPCHARHLRLTALPAPLRCLPRQAFGACLLRTRLRTFLWTQPLLLAPMLWMGSSHCASQLRATPEAATHLRRIAAAMQRGSSWLPVGPLLGGPRGSGAAAAAAAAASPQAACLAVHLWLVLVLSFCLPAIVIHRLEGVEEEGEEEARKQQRGAGGGASSGSARAGPAGAGAGAQRQLLHQQTPSLVHSAAELLLAGYAAWLFVQVVLMLAGQ